MRELCERKGIEIIEAELCRDHIHMLIRIPPKYNVSEIMGYLKGKSTLMIFGRHANMKYKYGNNNKLIKVLKCRVIVGFKTFLTISKNRGLTDKKLLEM